MTQNEVARIYEPVDAEDIVELHAARLLVLLLECGREFAPGRRGLANRQEMALLDTFLRFPTLAAVSLGQRTETQVNAALPIARYRFGPSDPRYREWFLFLECRELILRTGLDIDPILLTPSGTQLAQALASAPEWADQLETCAILRASLGGQTVPAIRRRLSDAYDRLEGDIPTMGQLSLDLGDKRYG